MRKSNCCVCATLFQIFTVLNIFYNKSEAEDTDIYIEDNFVGMKTIAERLRECGLFRNVYLYQEENEKNIVKRIENKVQRILYPQKYIERVVIDDVKISEKKYTDIYVSMTFRFSIAMMLSHSNAVNHYYDDGLGSYMGKIYDITIDRKWKLIYGAFGVSYKRLLPDIRHVYSVSLCRSKLSGELKEIPRNSYNEEQYLNFMKYIFDYESNSVYENKKCIYLTRPNMFGRREIDLLDEKIEKKLLNYRDDILVRIHQSDFRESIIKIDNDNKRKLWELVCLDHISEEMYLLSWFSTAQFMPKILFDKEPGIILTFPLYKKYFSEKEYEEFVQFTEDVKQIYRDKSKIIIIESLDALEQQLKRICLTD